MPPSPSAALLAVGGSHSAPGKGPFPADGLIPFLKPLADYGWAVGLVVGFLTYLVLTITAPSRQATATHAAPTF